jgi:glutathione S-transferase
LLLVIGNKAYSSWSLRPWVYMKQQGIAFEERRVPLFEGDYKAALLAHSPAGKVPALIDGGLTVWDSLAILEYLAEKYPDRRGWPENPAARAVARSVSAEMHSGFMAMRENLGMNVRRRYAPRTWPEPVAADIARVVEIWSLAKGPFLFGAFGIADAMYAPVAWRFLTYAVPLSGTARTYCDALLSLPAMREWEAGANAETEVIEKYEQAAPSPS